jgi:periplasmic protein TonB
MPHALLLSPDDQAVSAITGVLEEMSVSCERPLDGVSAAQKLSSQSFDLVLVDCENLPAAKLIFEVCRRGKNGNNPVPIAIVDGRAGLPTAFRLGAELILTKPVAKDQARSTIRTAVSRLRKDPAATEGFSAAMVTDRATEVADCTVGMGAAITATGTGMHEDDAPAMVAASVSPQLTSFAEPAPSFILPPVSKAMSNSVVEVSDGVASAAAAGAEHSPVSASPSIRSSPDNSGPDKSSPDKSSPDKSRKDKDKDKDEDKESSPVTSLRLATAGAGLKPSTQSPVSIQRPALLMKPSDDPVLAELERSELEETERKKNVVRDSEAPKEPPTEVVARRPHRQPKKEGALVGMFMLTVACGGFYAAWTYQPDFRAMAQPKVERLLALAGMALPPVQAPQSIRSPAPARPIAAAVATPVRARDLKDAVLAAPPKPATEELSIAVGASAPASSLTTSTSSAAVAPPSTSAAMTPVSKTERNKTGASKIGDNIADSKIESPAVSSEARVVEESNAIILSSKGAEKRLIHSVPPKYPAEARSRGAQGTIVLKTVVDENGKVASVRLVEGNAALANSAIEAVKQWRYRPYVRDGKDLSFQTVVIVDFQRP